MKRWLVIGAVVVSVVIAIVGTVLLVKRPDRGAGIDEAAFRQMASQTICAEQGIKVFAINERYVFFSRRGGCPDNYYAYRLYDKTPAHQLCEQKDTVTGPRAECRDGAPSDLFEKILANQDQPNLGLGSDYRVRQLHY